MPSSELLQDPLTVWQAVEGIVVIALFLIITAIYFQGPGDPPQFGGEEWA